MFDVVKIYELSGRRTWTRGAAPSEHTHTLKRFMDTQDGFLLKASMDVK